MVLDIPGSLFGDGGLFKPSPNDGQVDSAAGNRRIPIDQTVDTNALDWKGDWSDAVTYAVDDWVEHNGAAYKCILASTNDEPPNATYWDLISDNTHELDYIGDWDSGTTYNAEDWVTHDGALYRCKATTTNDEPPDASYWVLVSSDTQTKEFIVRFGFENGTLTRDGYFNTIVSVQLDSTDNCTFTFKVPNDFNVLSNCSILVEPNATETVQWDLHSTAVALGEDIDEGSETETLNMTLAVTQNLLSEMDITSAMPGTIAALDWIGVGFDSDTDHIYPIALRFRYL
jgi:hypothetical protein